MLWNEAESIGPLIDSLFNQTLFQKSVPGVDAVELVVLANGCTDESVPNSKAAIERNIAGLRESHITTRVVELPKGKEPSWNAFVHDLTPEDTDYIFSLDADIVITDPRTLEDLLIGLENNPHQHVATADGLKHIELAKRRGPWQSLTLAMTKMFRDTSLYHVNGQMYCGRASFLRCFEFPKGFVCGDDGFIAKMAITNLMTTEDEYNRIHYLDRPTYVFEAYLSPSRLFRQHRRRKIGAVTNAMIYDYVTARQTNHKPDAGVILRQSCKDDPEWLNRYVAEQIKKSGFWVVPLREIRYRFTQLRRLPFSKKILRFPLACAGAVWSLGVIIAANRMFSNDTYLGAWESMPNSEALESLLTESSSGDLQNKTASDK